MKNFKYALNQDMTKRINAVSEIQALAREMSSHAQFDPSSYFDLMIENWGTECNAEGVAIELTYEGEVLELTDDVREMKQIFVDEIVSIYPRKKKVATKNVYGVFVSPFGGQYEKITCKVVVPKSMTNNEIQTRIIATIGERGGYGDTPKFNFALVSWADVPMSLRVAGLEGVSEYHFTN